MIPGKLHETQIKTVEAVTKALLSNTSHATCNQKAWQTRRVFKTLSPWEVKCGSVPLSSSMSSTPLSALWTESQVQTVADCQRFYCLCSSVCATHKQAYVDSVQHPWITAWHSLVWNALWWVCVEGKPVWDEHLCNKLLFHVFKTF